MLSLTQIAWLAIIFLVASIISVIAGSTSLITVPVLLAFGLAPRTAIATNMMALTFMSIGGTIPFIGKNIIDTRQLPLLVLLTLVGSCLGALLVFAIPANVLPFVIFIALIGVALISTLNRNAGLEPPAGEVSSLDRACGYLVTFGLGIYGGFFSGGYVTLLTAAYILLFRMTFVQAIATTKLTNVFSSLVATLLFMSQGLVDYRLGLILGFAMFLGGILGGRLTLQLSNVWLKRIYLTVVWLLICFTLRKLPL